MPNSSRMSWSFPAENQDPWYDAFLGLVTAMDYSGFAAREDRNIVLMGGGLITFDAATDSLTWATPLVLLAPTTGFLWTIPAATISLYDGRLFYIDLVRAPQAPTSLTPVVSNQVPSTDYAFLLGVRRGSRVFFRNGAVARDGLPAAIIDDGSGGGGGTSLSPGFDRFTGTGMLLSFDLTNYVPVLQHPGVLLHRNGMLLDPTVAPALLDEYLVSNVGPITRVTLGAAPQITDRLFVTYWY